MLLTDTGVKSMNSRFLFALAAISSAVVSAQPRRAQITGGPPDRGKCTIEVVVDGTADVEVRGDTATLRNENGQPPQWRRFVCTSPLPANPADFRFAGVDGRGRQELVRDPRQGGVAVVRIEDPQGGAEGYTFDLTWGGGQSYPSQGYPSQGYPSQSYPATQPPPAADRNPDRRYDDDHDSYSRSRDDYFRRDNWRSRMFERVRDDIDHVSHDSFRGADRYRLDRVRQELDELQSQSSSGRYDNRLLDDVIGTLDRILRDDRLHDSDRAMISDDMNRLREFRDRR